jgi:hypothetical protein
MWGSTQVQIMPGQVRRVLWFPWLLSRRRSWFNQAVSNFLQSTCLACHPHPKKSSKCTSWIGVSAEPWLDLTLSQSWLVLACITGGSWSRIYLTVLGYQPQRRAIILVNNTPVDGWIGHWNVVKKQYEGVEYIAVKQWSDYLWVTILSVQCAVIGGIFCHCSLLAILRRKIGKPRKEIRNLNGFEYRYLHDLTVP